VTTVTADERPAHNGGPKPLLDGRQSQGRSVVLHIFVLAPTLALAAAVPLAWGWKLTWLDVGLAVGFYLLSGFGVTVGFHRHFTHRPLAVLSMGESWHNLHHADPTCARHGVRRGQVDMSARVIWFFEKLGWAHDIRWPTPTRLARLDAAPHAAAR
jgi:fatty-acid desaturase